MNSENAPLRREPAFVYQLFREHRKRHGASAYSDRLKNLAVELVASGVARVEVAKCCEISDSTLYKWQVACRNHAQECIPVRRLAVLQAAEPVSISQTVNEETNDNMRIAFPSGILIELSQRATTAQFLQKIREAFLC